MDLNIASIARSYVSKNKFENILDFRESKAGLGREPFPVIRFVLKVCYALELDDKEKVINYKDNYNDQTLYRFTEKEFWDYLYENQRVNLKEPPQKVYNHLIWVNGRRGFKTTTSSEMDLWELWCDLENDCPQTDIYKLLETSPIRFTNVASSGLQSDIYYNSFISGINDSVVFKPFIGRILSTKAMFNTRHDLRKIEQNPNWNSSFEVSSSPCSGRTSRGPGCRCLTFDEFAFFLEALKGKGSASDSSVHKALVPATVTFGDKRRIKELSSPYTQSGLFWQHYKESFDNKNYLMLRLRSFDTNPTLEPKTLREEYEKDPGNYSFEYLAEFTGSTVNYIDRASVDKVSGPVILDRTRQFFFYYGLDLGLGNDGTGIAVSHVEQKKKIVLDHQRTIYAGKDKYEGKKFLDFEDIISELTELKVEFPPRAGVYDQWNGFGLEAYLKKIKYDEIFEMVTFNRATNSEIAKLLKRLILSGTDILINNQLKEFIDELVSVLQVNVSKYLIQVEAPSGDHDDSTDSVMRSVWTAYKKGVMEGEEPAKNSPLFEIRKMRRDRYTPSLRAMRSRRPRHY